MINSALNDDLHSILKKIYPIRDKLKNSKKTNSELLLKLENLNKLIENAENLLENSKKVKSFYKKK